jgi:hypothetical protein
MRMVRAAVVGTVAVGLAWFTPAMAGASTVGDWQMNEVTGSTRMIDSSGNGLDGNIGPDVVLHEATPDGGAAYRFKGDWWVVNPNRLVTWADDDRLDPGTQPYAVTIRMKTGALDPNIIQKGQDNQTGGYFKLAMKKGWPRCHFEDANRNTRAIGFVNDPRPETKISDGQWHTIRCEKTATGVKLTINYGEPNAISKFIKGTLGPIDNNKEMFLGGKLYCDGSTVTCDYFAGAVDWVTIERPGV